MVQLRSSAATGITFGEICKKEYREQSTEYGEQRTEYGEQRTEYGDSSSFQPLTTRLIEAGNLKNPETHLSFFVQSPQ